MKSYRLKIMYVSILCFHIISCNHDSIENIAGSKESHENVTEPFNEIELTDGLLQFHSQESLTDFIENSSDVDLDNKISDLMHYGFQPLRPMFKDLDSTEIEQFLARKLKKINSNGILYSMKMEKDGIDLDDELISDNKFAKLLNEDRAIIVGDSYYIYTTNGLYFCKKKHRKKLKKYLKALGNDKSFKPSLPRGCDARKINTIETGLSMTPIPGKVTSITTEISRFSTSCGGGSGGGGGNPKSPPVSNLIPMLISQNFGTCTYSENSLFQQIFGNTVKCNDYHDSKHRIQTKVWNENYFIWSSVGASAKYQKKRAIGWSESSTSDGVRLGINHAIYTYKTNFSPYKAHDPKRVIFKYKGVNYDQYGKIVPSYPINSSTWPFPKNETIGSIEIYIFGNDKYWPLTGKDANKSINQLLSQARSVIKGLSNDMVKDKVGVQIVKFLPTSFKITRADILLKHKSKAKMTFDFNFLLKFKSRSSGTFQTLVNQLNSKKYEKIEIDMYGAAIRNAKWKGKRIIGNVN